MVGVCLDCNGLWLVWYWRIKDDFIYVVLEVGVFDIEVFDVMMKGWLGLGMMICVNLEIGEVMFENFYYWMRGL